MSEDRRDALVERMAVLLKTSFLHSDCYPHEECPSRDWRVGRTCKCLEDASAALDLAFEEAAKESERLGQHGIAAAIRALKGDNNGD